MGEIKFAFLNIWAGECWDESWGEVFKTLSMHFENIILSVVPWHQLHYRKRAKSWPIDAVKRWKVKQKDPIR